MGFAATAALFLFHAPVTPRFADRSAVRYGRAPRGANEFHRCRGGVHIGHNVIRLYTCVA